MTGARKIGIIAGDGALPAQLLRACRGEGRDVFAIALDGITVPETVADCPHEWVNIAKVGKIIDLLRGNHCVEVCLAGGVGRPDLSSLKPDFKGMALVSRLVKAAKRGEGAILETIVSYLGEQGFRVVGAEEVMGSILARSGVLGAVTPTMTDQEDIDKGIAVIDALGSLDVGQGCVVRDGLVLAVEAAEGTDAMVARCAQFRRDEPGGVLIKLTKPGQERRVDLPTIGRGTVEVVRDAGLHGIAVEATGALIVDLDDVVAAADAAGIFLFGVDVAR
jgi:DUF1009 family protein